METTGDRAAGVRSLRSPLAWLAIVVAVGLLLFVYHYLAVVVEGGRETPWRPFVNELTGALASGLLFFPIRALVRRRPLTAAAWPRRVPLYLLALAACGATATTLIWVLRSAVYPMAGLGRFDYGAMPLRYLMEAPLQVIWFTVVVAALHAAYALQAARRRELRAAHLETSLARAQLRSLRLQLQPHFLFNALNTISATMYDDPHAADEMLDQLAELLRASLRTAQSDEVPLGDELALLDRYLALLRARFGERLAISIEVEPGSADALVPSMILQPLVENAVRHGNAERSGRGAVGVRVRRGTDGDGGRLLLEVEDDGAGEPEGKGNDAQGATDDAGRGFGIGLAGTAERLQLLYGADHGFRAGPAANGFRVELSLPLRRRQGAA